ncbi:hypothetical protein [Flavihumibacter fluvii]|uniref:hypothetical protein n=1 Tax=Flavihumibacter fluvii TaxID=2838157 RepID=UPI001BDED7DD|nr:hypothetical protein [Flavihumibacter fluvii]ULQ51112.1 hypothetical protein KJS93_13570 [Flavihumibacter fluvii]
MATNISGLDTLQDIRKMMEKSSRFISLSGWSGMAAGTCALIGAAVGRHRIMTYYEREFGQPGQCDDCLKTDLISMAAVVFLSALFSALLFTYLRSKKDGVAIWGPTSRRLLWNTVIPMGIGAIFIARLLQQHQYDLVPAASLVFYGLALLNGSRYTLGEVQWLGYAEIVTGLVCLWLPGSGIYFWAFGFGVLHIVYGFSMWWKYERKEMDKS